MEIKTSELRIGNLLYYKGADDIAIVDLIHGKNHFDCRDEFGSFTPNADYKPIALTEDWLLKFGFNKCKNLITNSNSFDNGFIEIYVVNDADYYHFSHGIYSISKIHFIHQLQNLYHSLTGQELTIK